jgi:hypothetical protein
MPALICPCSSAQAMGFHLRIMPHRASTQASDAVRPRHRSSSHSRLSGSIPTTTCTVQLTVSNFVPAVAF